MDDFTMWVGILGIVVGLPWLILHYVTKWKTASKITPEDENLLDEMFNLARRLEDRVNTVERIVAADNPDWKPGLDASRSDWKSSLNAPETPYQIDRRN